MQKEQEQGPKNRMMLKDLIFSFLMLGFIEALGKPLAMRFFQRKTIKYGAIALRFIDENLYDIMDATDRDLETELKEYLENVTNTQWNNKELDEIFRIHDLRLTPRSNGN